MNPFDTINYLMFEKRKPLDNEVLSNFNPFITTKTFSFYNDGEYVNYINDTLNTYGNVFNSSEDQFRFFESVMPIVKRKRSSYMKKEAKEEDKTVSSPIIPEFYSRREWERLTNSKK